MCVAITGSGYPCSVRASAPDQSNYAGVHPLDLDMYRVLNVLSEQKEA